MRLFADQNVYWPTVQLLRQAGHDVVTASEAGMAKASDADLLRVAWGEDRLFVTHDRDFGGLVFVSAASGGVLCLRMTLASMAVIHRELDRVPSLYDESELREAFVVVEPGRHRIRRRPRDPEADV